MPSRPLAHSLWDMGYRPEQASCYWTDLPVYLAIPSHRMAPQYEDQAKISEREGSEREKKTKKNQHRHPLETGEDPRKSHH